jgi:hypothetical protein
LDGDGNIVGFDIDNTSRLGASLREFIASDATVEDLALAWASRDDKRDSTESLTASERSADDYLDYFAEIEEVLQQAAKYAEDRRAISSSSPANR